MVVVTKVMHLPLRLLHRPVSSLAKVFQSRTTIDGFYFIKGGGGKLRRSKKGYHSRAHISDLYIVFAPRHNVTGVHP
jgi:hypothetical protein